MVSLVQNWKVCTIHIPMHLHGYVYRALDLGRWGYSCNIFAPLWITVVGVMVCFPPGLPVAVSSMNCTAPVLMGLVFIILAFWFVVGNEFKGPDIDWEMLNLKNEVESKN